MLGHNADGWENAGLHNLLVGKVAGMTLQYAGCTTEEIIRAMYAGVIHDARQRRLKEAAGNNARTVNGITTYDMSQQAIEATERLHLIEAHVPGLECVHPDIHAIIQVTSLNWDYPYWSNEMAALRYADSCVGSLPQESGVHGNAEDLLGYDARIRILKQRKPEFTDDWDRLFTLTQNLERNFICLVNNWNRDTIGDIPQEERTRFLQTIRNEIGAQTPLPYIALAA
ncbi:MAG: hypothetical protein ACEQSA_01480 [Weeksellaceae bacterium]